MTYPDRYLFDEHYGYLNAYDQGQYGTCYSWSRALHAEANALMHGNPLASPWPSNPDHWPQWQETSIWEPVYKCVYYFNKDGRELRLWEDGYGLRKPDQETWKRLLITGGVIQLAISVPNSFNAVGYNLSSMPIVEPRADDQEVSGHSITAVGYEPVGLVVQNQWGGKAWGYKGRAILTWAWLERFSLVAQAYSLDPSTKLYDAPSPLPPARFTWPKPEDVKTEPLPVPVLPSPTPAPAPTPVEDETDMAAITLFRLKKADGSISATVWAACGGVRSWIPSGAVLDAQHMDRGTIETVTGSSPLWTLPVVGNKPAHQ